jgi:hypothetical protein
MTDLAQFIAARAMATPPVSVEWMTTAITYAAEELRRGITGERVVNETEIWNALLGRICDGIETRISAECRIRALNLVKAVADRQSLMGMDLIRIRDDLFEESRTHFRRECTEQRAHLWTLIPGRIAAAESRLRESIERDLHDYRERRLFLLNQMETALGEAKTEAVRAVDALSVDEALTFNIVATRREIARRVKAKFRAQIQGRAELSENFPDDVSECEGALVDVVEEHLDLRRANRFVPALVRVLFPVGTIWIGAGETKPAWMDNGWERIQEGRVLVSSSQDGRKFANDSTGGVAEHSHDTAPHVLTIAEIPPHDHGSSPSPPGPYYYRQVSDQTGSCPRVTKTGGGQAHSHGPTRAASNYPPYVCVTFWKRVR